MALDVQPIQITYRYNGVTLEAPKGMTVEQVKKFHSVIHKELLNAEPDYGEVIDGKQTITFRVARLRDKGGDGLFAEFTAKVRAIAEGKSEPDEHTLLLLDLQTDSAVRASKALVQLASGSALGIPAPSSKLAPLI